MRHQGGFSLLEIMITSTLLATAVLGLTALSVRIMEDSATSREELAAENLLRDLRGRYKLLGRPPVTPELLTGASDAFAGSEVLAWQQSVSGSLPSGAGVVCADSTPDDGNHTAPACDNSGPVIGKVFWLRSHSPEPRRRVGVLN